VQLHAQNETIITANKQENWKQQ